MIRTFTRSPYPRHKRQRFVPLTLDPLSNSVSDSLVVTEIFARLSTYIREVTDIPLLIDTLIQDFVYSRTIEDTLEFTETFFEGDTIHESYFDTLVLDDTILFLAVRNISRTDSLSFTELFSRTFIASRDLDDTLTVSDTISLIKAVGVQFSVPTLPTNTITIPLLDSLTIYPYNYIDPINYGFTNYSFMSSTNFSTICLFRLSFPTTFNQRQLLHLFFSYWRTEPFTIQIGEDIWRGYLTPENRDLLKSQFDQGLPLTLEFEASKAK